MSVTVPAAKTADGNMTIAAAAAVNVDLTSGTATIAPGGAVTTSSPLVVHTISLENATSRADGTSADNAVTGIGASLAINVPRPSFQATIAGAATAPAVTVQTLMQTGTTNTFSATAWSGGVQRTPVWPEHYRSMSREPKATRASRTANLSISGGALTVNAAQNTENDSTAFAKTSPSRTAIGIGASVAVNVALNSSQAEIGAATITGVPVFSTSPTVRTSSTPWPTPARASRTPLPPPPSPSATRVIPPRQTCWLGREL